MFQNNVDYVYSSMSSVSSCTLLIVQTLIVLKILTILCRRWYTASASAAAQEV